MICAWVCYYKVKWKLTNKTWLTNSDELTTHNILFAQETLKTVFI